MPFTHPRGSGFNSDNACIDLCSAVCTATVVNSRLASIDSLFIKKKFVQTFCCLLSFVHELFLFIQRKYIVQLMYICSLTYMCYFINMLLYIFSMGQWPWSNKICLLYLTLLGSIWLWSVRLPFTYPRGPGFKTDNAFMELCSSVLLWKLCLVFIISSKSDVFLQVNNTYVWSCQFCKKIF